MKELDSLLTSNISTQNVDGEKTPKYDFDEPEEGGQIGNIIIGRYLHLGM